MRNFLFVILATLLTACSSDEPEKKAAKRPLPPTVHEEDLRKFTGARTKVAWTQFQNKEKVDKQGTSRHHFLYAVDSADGRGNHKVLEAEGNYAYPIITPDGEHIVFTRKKKIIKGDKRKFDPTIEIVNFDGTGLKQLAPGYAQEVWEDPETGKYWIYAGDEFILGSSTAPVCKRIIRFPLEDPSKREVVWDRTQMGTDSFAISGDGKRFAGLFPWPKAGIGDLEKNDWETLTNGCWVAMAPDNSYRSWVFDGAHKNFLMFDANGKQTATIPVNNHPELRGKEVYHPRWGNHSRFFVLSGPHTGRKSKRRGEPIEIFLGKFSPEFDRVESWFKISDNSLPDIYPDVWIEGGSKSVLATVTDPAPLPTKAKKWPSNPEGLIFKWQNVQAKNEFTAPDGSNQVTKVEPKEFARYGPHHQMDLSGGRFIPILGSDAFVNVTPTAEIFGFQATLTASSSSGYIFDAGERSLSIVNGQLLFSGTTDHLRIAEIPLGRPTHIAITETPAQLEVFINGKPAPSEPSGHSDNRPADLTFGRNLDGYLEHIAFYNRAITAEEAAADYALVSEKIAERNPIERIRVRGKLVTMNSLPTLEDIKPYPRGLVYYAYETDDPKLKTIAVAHWAILDKNPVGGLPREIGKTYDLILEPFFDHPVLSSQAESRDGDLIDPTLLLFHDVTTPKP